MNTDKTDFTQGSILKKLSLFMLPVLGALVLQAAYGAVDLLVVGHFGSTAGLSAVSTGSQLLNLVTFVVTQLAMGVTVLIARYIGEKKPQQIGAVLGGAAVVFAIMSVVLFILLVAFARPIAVLMQAPEEAIGLTASYIRICGSGIFFIVAYNLMAPSSAVWATANPRCCSCWWPALSTLRATCCWWPGSRWMLPVLRRQRCWHRLSAWCSPL